MKRHGGEDMVIEKLCENGISDLQVEGLKHPKSRPESPMIQLSFEQAALQN